MAVEGGSSTPKRRPSIVADNVMDGIYESIGEMKEKEKDGAKQEVVRPPKFDKNKSGGIGFDNG